MPTDACPVAVRLAKKVKRFCGKAQDKLIFRHGSPAAISMAKGCIKLANQALYVAAEGRCREAVVFLEEANVLARRLGDARWGRR